MRLPYTALILLTVLSVAELSSGCRETPGERYARRLSEVDEAERHAVHTERLFEVMNGLKALTNAALPQELDVEIQHGQRRTEVSTIADAMSRAAAMIPDVLTDVELPAEQAEAFRVLASSLERQSHDLGETAQDLSIEELDDKLTKILDTCDACHTRFRVLPVVPRP